MGPLCALALISQTLPPRGAEIVKLARIEANKKEVTWQRVRAILLAMGLEPDLDVKALEHGTDVRHSAVARSSRPDGGVYDRVVATHFPNVNLEHQPGGDVVVEGLAASRRAARHHVPCS